MCWGSCKAGLSSGHKLAGTAGHDSPLILGELQTVRGWTPTLPCRAPPWCQHRCSIGSSSVPEVAHILAQPGDSARRRLVQQQHRVAVGFEHWPHRGAGAVRVAGGANVHQCLVTWPASSGSAPSESMADWGRRRNRRHVRSQTRGGRAPIQAQHTLVLNGACPESPVGRSGLRGNARKNGHRDLRGESRLQRA